MMPILMLSLNGDGSDGSVGAHSQKSWQPKLIAARNGDEHARSELCLLVWRAAHNYACVHRISTYSSSEQDFAQDIVQLLLQQLDTIENLPGWFSVVSWRARANVLRANRYASIIGRLPNEDDTDDGQDFWSSLPDAHILSGMEVDGLLDELPGYQKEVVMLRYVDDLSYREIAKIMAKKEGTVRAQYLRALKRLRYLMDDNLGEVVTNGIESRRTPDTATRSAVRREDSE